MNMLTEWISCLKVINSFVVDRTTLLIDKVLISRPFPNLPYSNKKSESTNFATLAIKVHTEAIQI